MPWVQHKDTGCELAPASQWRRRPPAVLTPVFGNA